jgi:polar amino acid transport system permease protein
MIEGFLKLLPYLLQGMVVTLEVTAISLSIGFVLGILLAIMRVYGGKVFAIIAAIYSTVMRAIPVLLVVLILYFVITSIINLPAFWAGSLALGFVSAAYQSEILRGAFLSIPKGQMMAARSIGMTRIRAIRFIIIPSLIW